MTRFFRAALVLALLGFSSGTAFAVQPDEVLKDTQLEQRARDLSTELRCLVCQNQSIDDSDAPLAKDLRVLVRERLQAGDSDNKVLDFVVARYGEFILLRPRLTFKTYVLWLAPLIILLSGIMLTRRLFWRNDLAASPPPLTDEETKRLRKVLQQ